MIENLISLNRAEELGFDIWEDYVIPPFYSGLDLQVAKKPRVIVGGRGCGKTSLLRYLCHQSQFSTKRPSVSIDDLKHIGIYWKIDTQFAKILTKRGVDDELWRSAFEHLAVLIMAQEILKSIESIANSNYQGFNFSDIETFDFDILSSFDKKIPNTFVELKQYLRKEFNFFQTWTGSIRKLEQPVFLRKHFIVELITEIKSQNINFKETNYFVYVDEYENLIADQQRLINTWLKHSEMPLIFNLAMKPYSFEDKQTIGNESIASIQDYREFNLEDLYTSSNFPVFAAEVLFLRIWKNNKDLEIPFNPTDLNSSSIDKIQLRKNPEYCAQILSFAKQFLPSSTTEEIAKEIFQDPTLYGRLESLFFSSTKRKDVLNNVEAFLVKDFPQASLIIPSLLSRRISPSTILEEIEKLRTKNDNKFTGATAWIHNNIFACILLIYEPLGRVCPLYAGFDAFCLMAKTNLRYFLEMCNKSIINENLTIAISPMTDIPMKSQGEAAKLASTSFLRDVKNFGNNGHQLHTFVIRLGTIFKSAGKRISQSEPEQNQFTIKGNKSPRLTKLLEDAVKWSVLYETKITKQKGGQKKLDTEDYEYILNPIYAPYFHISYRKKRNLVLESKQLEIIAFGSYDEFGTYLRKTLTDWKLTQDNETFDLFEILEVN